MDYDRIDERKREIKEKRIRQVKAMKIALSGVAVCVVCAGIGLGVHIGRGGAKEQAATQEVQAKQVSSEKKGGEDSSFEKLPETAMGAVVKGKTVIYKEAAGSGEEAEILEELSFGDKVTLLEEQSSWYQVKKDDVTGYMKKSELVYFDSSKSHIALTFDDGPSSKTTPEVLDALEKYKCRATFFTVGQNITPKTGEILGRAVKLGCEIGNHTYSHANLAAIKKKTGIKKEVEDAKELITKYSGEESPYVRTPYGSTSKKVLSAIGSPNIYWSVDTEDWKYRDTGRLVKYVKKHASDGDIVLMHDIHTSTAEGVAKICKNLVQAGYEAVTITELAAIKGVTLVNGETYYSFTDAKEES